MKRLALAAVATLLLAACTTTKPTVKNDMLDLKIVNGRILDGTGAPWFRGDVGIRGNTIVAIGNLRETDAKTVIDAKDRIVAPGFIDLLGQSQMSVLVDPNVEAKVRQGVTTEVTGEGHSPGPVTGPPTKERPWQTLGDYLDLLDRRGTAINFALFVGSSNPRAIVIGDGDRQPSGDEMRQMEAIVDQAMRDGAIGLSSSLIYVPAMYSTTEELVNLARVAAKHGGVYFTHMRDEGDRIDMGLDEAFRIGREANIPVNIWHLKLGGRPNWGRMPHVIERIEEARRNGIDVAANVYPYPASGTSLSTLAPDWAMNGGYDDFRERLKKPEDRARIIDALRAQVARRGEKGIFVARIGNPAQAQYAKKFIEEIARDMNVAPEQALVKLFEENESSPFVIYFSMHEDDVQYALKQPFVSVGADSGAPTPSTIASNSYVHPRAYGTFARVLGHYVRDVKLFTLEEAVRKLTSQAALRAGFTDRGVIREGMKADVVVFDPANVRDLSRFEDPHHYSEGVSDVVVNGVPVLRDGKMTGALPGKTIRGRGYRASGER
ncbi:MAG TPA: D-aminoacylase [Thermoanaerobaculia bacterium]|jgi:dihydroorotase/N-acyl-D-amino-acid deacylase